MKKIIYVFLLLFSYSVYSQSLSVFNVDVSAFPTIKANFYALDSNGIQILDLSKSDFQVYDNGLLKAVSNISCPDPDSRPAVSSVLVFDMSSSMKEGPPRIESAKKAANAWVDGLPLGKSECALVSFSDFSSIVSDFTTNRQLLKNSIEQFIPTENTNYNQALIDKPCGGLQVAKLGKHKRVVVFLTDGLPNFTPDVNEIINFAKQNQITIYAVTLDMPAPQCIKDITLQTGGAYFENITTQDEAKNTYLKLLNLAQSYKPCEIEWESDWSCSSGVKNVEVKLITNNLNSKITYFYPNDLVANLEFSLNRVDFKNISPGQKKDAVIKVTARNADLNIQNITSSNPKYSVNPTSFILPKDKSIELIVSYLPNDSNYSTTIFKVESNLCPFYFYASGYYIGQKPKIPTLKLLSPNGGESYIVGTDTVISWEGIPANDNVKLEYSNDNGTNWLPIVNETSGLYYIWKNIPKPAGNQNLIRVTQFIGGNGNINQGTLHLTVPGYCQRFYDVAWNKFGNRIATCLDKSAIIYDSYNGNEIFNLIGHNDKVYDVVWNPDGNKVVTSSEDKTAIIWDANTGAKLFTLKGHKRGVNNVSWSPDGKRIATASSDSTIIIWDATNGKKLKTLKGHTSEVMKVCWNPDSRKLVSIAKFDSKAIIWNAVDGTMINTLSGHTNYILDASWSPNGLNIATTSDDKHVIIWDAVKDSIIHKLDGKHNYSNNVSWSSDGRFIVTSACSDKCAILWDVASGAMIYELKGHTDCVNYVSWSPDNTRLATTSFDSTAIIWDVASGTKLYTLKGHTDWVNKISWSPDGYRVATSSYDGNAKIWFADYTKSELQNDESDQVFSIIAPIAEANDIDMKQCLNGSIKDSVINDYIHNIGFCQLQIDSIYFSGPDASAFKIVSCLPKYNLNPGEAKAAEFLFIPNKLGIHNAKINIISQSDTIIKSIIGEGVKPQLQILTNFLDFGKVELGDEKTIQDTVLIKNISDNSIFISNVDLLGPDTKQFKIIDGGNSFTLLPDKSRKLTIRFQPIYGGRTSGQLGFDYHGINSPLRVQLFGTGIGGSVFISDDSSLAGEKRNLKLMMSNIKPEGIAAIAPNYEAVIKFNNTILTPLDRSNSSLVNDSIYLTISGAFGTSNVLAQLPVVAGFGNTSETTVDIVKFNLKDNLGNTVDYNFEKESGTFKLLGICREGGTRLFNPTGKAEILSILPNPASEDIEIKLNLIEDGATSVSIFALNGAKIKEFNISGVTGQQTIKLNGREFANGLYFIQLQTPTVLENQKLMIIK